MGGQKAARSLVVANFNGVFQVSPTHPSSPVVVMSLASEREGAAFNRSPFLKGRFSATCNELYRLLVRAAQSLMAVAPATEKNCACCSVSLVASSPKLMFRSA